MSYITEKNSFEGSTFGAGIVAQYVELLPVKPASHPGLGHAIHLGVTPWMEEFSRNLPLFQLSKLKSYIYKHINHIGFVQR